ncbi:hypothetical protein Tco_0060172 [Tanacetum coccineum]
MTAQTFKETIIQNMNSIEQCIIERASHEQELKMTLKKLSVRQLQIQQCKVQEVQSSVTSSGDETSSGIVSDEEIEKKELEAHYGFMAKIQEVLPAESSSIDTPLEQKDDSNVTPDSSNICNNDNQVDQNAVECAADERAALANLIANLTLDTEENKTILKQLKKANASLTQELKECKTNLDESSRALGEATSSRDSSLIALQTKQTELEKYTALNDLTSDYKILQTKLNDTLGLLAIKNIDIEEGLKTKTYEISVVNQKHDELVKKSLLNRSQFEGQLKEKTKVISDLKVKEGKDIDTMIEMEKQIKKSKKSCTSSERQRVNGKPSIDSSCLITNTANGCKPNHRKWQASMSSRVSNKDVHLGEHRKQKPFLKFNELQCPTCKKCLYSANHDECVLEYLSRLNTRASAQNKDAKSHKTTKRYMPVEKSSASKKPERQIPTGHRFSNKKTTTVPEKTRTPRSYLRWQPTGRILKTVCLRWVPTGKLLNSCTGKVDSEPTHGSIVDIPHIQACKQTLGLSAADQASVFMAMTSVHISSGLVLHQMTSDHNRSELGIQDHSNEQSSSKLVPKVVP